MDQRNCKRCRSRQDGVDPCSTSDRPYRLTSDSPCRDQGDPASYPPDDWKGNPDPAAPRADCGADEFHPE